MIIILLGPQGSGKGTQAKLLAKKYKLSYVATGDIFRQMAETNKEIEKMLVTGELFPDNLVIKTIVEYLQSHNIKDNLVLDGFPRRLNQYIELKRKLRMPDLAILIDISHKESVRRLEGRRNDPTTGSVYNLATNPPPPGVDVAKLVQREDDKPAAIKKRLEEYEADTKPLVKFLEEEGILVRVDGERQIEDIHNDLVRIVESKLHGKH